MDGHGGYYTSSSSRASSSTPSPSNSRPSPSPSPGPQTSSTNKIRLWGPRSPAKAADVDIHSTHTSTHPPPSPAADPRARDPERLPALDAELIAAPHRRHRPVVPDLSTHPLALPAMLPALSGSCALLALLDTAHRNLYVACTGDSRAVAGVWEPAAAAGGGPWRVEVLSEDQMPAEVAWMPSKHPAPEAGDVIRNGRVLGGLEPARAFGDARYKWSRGLQQTLYTAFFAGSDRPMRAPPYVTARPVVTHHMLHLPPAGADAAAPTGAMRFIVLATDGLWDELSSEDVVRLVGGHLAGLTGAVPKAALPALVPTVAGARAVEGKDARRARDVGEWAFVDADPSAHLIRNAFGGADEGALRRLLSIPAPLARRHRDDVSVTVVWWEEGPGVGAEGRRRGGGAHIRGVGPAA
ncbi:phosphatase 2C-like domain-containing protein [Mycena rosella]|uniref:Phosphatase 2C-like domain-containing protein n=1 Tax=Mycena rosella TaxID=1033263 RepID=A0AAD7CMI7_MYCRO|nr:phosphatase 2C-like domain-containing protein [Mycena rosella]